jgi:endonuclease YncB( thermonuclease family)
MKRYILALAIITSCFVSVDASSLYGKVIDVNSGDAITILNLNRPVRVKLLGVDAPELNQAFGDVAKKHLTDLIFEKSVVVEYAGIAADHSLTGRVLLNDTDIGAQMIRDGAAWFDPGNGNRLSADDREVYLQSEQAARTEKRGLWQQENPVAPWEFVKAEAMRRAPAPSVKQNVAETKPKRSGSFTELTNLTLMAVRANSASAPSELDSPWSGSAARKNWSRFQAPGESLSVEMPEDGEHMETSAQEADQLGGYRVRDGWALYALAWGKDPSFGESDEAVFKKTIEKLTRAAVESYRDSSGEKDLTCQSPAQKNASQNGYAGIDVDLNSCRIPIRIRMYTKVVDGQRAFYLGTVMYGEGETENVRRFMNSFRIGSATKPSTKTR